MITHNVTPETLLRLCSEQIARGAEITGFPYMRGVLPKRCERPLEITLVSQVRDNYFTTQHWMKTVTYRAVYDTRILRPFSLHLFLPCRKCAPCLKLRSFIWHQRALKEFANSKRTWFCTFTIAPEHRVRSKILARQRYGDESFLSIYKIISSWFTLYLKRVRKQSGVKLRFVLAAEEHADGYPHLHALIHEVDVSITKRLLQGQWPYGFTNVKLATPASAGYVTKYLAKSMLSRIRASLRYGTHDITS